MRWAFPARSIRRVIVFCLGVLIILDGLYGRTSSLAELIIGAIMVGVLPIEDLMITRPSLSFRNRPPIDTQPPADIPSQATKQEAPSAPDESTPE